MIKPFGSFVLFAALSACVSDVSSLDGQVDAETVALDASARGTKVDICHYSADEDSWHVINISTSAVDRHFANHGDSYPGTYYPDGDGDGYGDAAGATSDCPEAGYVTDGSDCDDGNADTNPGAGEVCDDGVDNNCDGVVDEGCPVGISNPVSSAEGYNFEWSNGGNTYAGAGDAICAEYGYASATYVEVCGTDETTAVGFPECAFTTCEMWYRPDGWIVGNCDAISYLAVTYIECL